MKLSEYLSKKRGRGAALASILGVRPQTVYQWASGRRAVPVERCTEIEEATLGEVTRIDLCDEWERIWPELARRRRSTDKSG